MQRISGDSEGADAREQTAFSEALARERPWIFATAGLVVANVVVYAAVVARLGGQPDAYELIDLGSGFALGAAAGEPWRLVTALFVHANLAHLALNMVALVDLGRHCERLFGSARFVALYMTSGVTGVAVSVAADPLVNTVGASGAIFGTLGGLLILMLVRESEFPLVVLKARATALAALLIYSAGAAAAGEPVDHVAHFAGLAAGAIAAAFLLPPRAGTTSIAARAIPWIGIVALTAGAVALFHGAPPPSVERVDTWQAERSYAAAVKWFRQEEPLMLQREQALLRTAERPDTKAQLRDVAGNWREVHARFSGYRLPPERDRIREAVAEYAALKARAFGLLADASPDEGREPAAFKALIQQAKIVEYSLRATLHLHGM